MKSTYIYVSHDGHLKKNKKLSQINFIFREEKISNINIFFYLDWQVCTRTDHWDLNIFLLFYWTLLSQRCRQRNFNINIMTVIIYNSLSHVGLLLGLLEVICKLKCKVKFSQQNCKFQVTVTAQVTTNCFIIIHLPTSISWPEILQNFCRILQWSLAVSL